MSSHRQNPAPTVDIIIEINEQIVLIERKNKPLGWALPGGFVDIGESLEQAAVREAREETCLDVQLFDLLYVYSDPHRDPRQHTISAVFMATAHGAPKGADDAQRAELFELDNLPAPLCFDHAQILHHYKQFKSQGVKPSPLDMLAPGQGGAKP